MTSKRKSEIYCRWKSPNVAARAMPVYVNAFINCGGVLPRLGFQDLFRRPRGHWRRNSTSA